MWNFTEDNLDYEMVQNYLTTLQCENTDRDLNDLLDRTQKMVSEVDQIRRETDSLKNRFTEFDQYITHVEKRLEDLRRDQNKSAVIMWNFPDDLHPTMLASASPQAKQDTVREFLTRTVGIADDVIKLITIDHIRVFYTVYKSERSTNVRLQFGDHESKTLCEMYCLPFLRTFNQMRPVPTRWKDDQTEMQRDEVKEQRMQKQKHKSNGQKGLLFTKFIRWPPLQKA